MRSATLEKEKKEIFNILNEYSKFSSYEQKIFLYYLDIFVVAMIKTIKEGTFEL